MTFDPSLNVSVPVEIDGESIDAAHAPILFSNSVGGYMSSSVTESKKGGFPDGADRASNPDLALAAGYVEPGARRRDLASTGDYCGVAPRSPWI